MVGVSALRPLGALDLDRAAALHHEAFVPFGERGWTRQDMAELLASPGVAGLLLQIDGADAGMAICRVAADESELITIAVRPTCRRQGVGRALLAAVLDHVRARGARTLFLEVAADNPAARTLYESAGFRAAGKRPGYFRRGDCPAADALVMSLDLA
jgi:[ribosomal protein S18]-alanine N-acetyltransferase